MSWLGVYSAKLIYLYVVLKLQEIKSEKMCIKCNVQV